MTTTIKKWGNSQGIIIPKTILAKMRIDQPEQTRISMHVDEAGDLIIRKVSKKSKLEKRFEGFDLDAYYQQYGKETELDWGHSVGDEVL